MVHTQLANTSRGPRSPAGALPDGRAPWATVPLGMRSARSCTLVILPSMSSTLRCLAMLNSFLIFGYFKKGSASGYFAWITCSFTFSMAFWNS